MPKKISEYTLDDGQVIAFEVEEPQGSGYRRISRSNQDDDETRSFRTAIQRLHPVTNDLFDSLRNLVSEPQQIEVEFGIKMSVAAGVLIASTSGEANFKVKLVWKQDAKPSQQPADGPEDPAA